ncbi:MAG: HAD family hydrolase [Candidatus Omnitrophica bacterium]|nr:HAD family hydrolase [Candidatus Omnitrophota bacterium]
MQRNNKTIFLDRDGVLIADPIGNYIMSPADLKLLPGVIEGVRLLHWAGFRLIMISNQAGIGDGVYKFEALEKVTGKLCNIFSEHGVRFDGIYYCLHGKLEACGCRKPRTGLFWKAAGDFAIDRRNSYFIGDKISDVEAGKEFGVRVIMLRTGHGRLEEKLITTMRPDHLADTFMEAVQVILGGRVS